MSFHYSAQDCRVDDGHMLRGRLQNGNGDWQDAEIDLNNFIGNQNGNFVWGQGGFSGSAENIRFSMEGDNQPILRASLDNGNGGREDRDINLGEKIGNNNGQFQYND